MNEQVLFKQVLELLPSRVNKEGILYSLSADLSTPFKIIYTGSKERMEFDIELEYEHIHRIFHYFYEHRCFIYDRNMQTLNYNLLYENLGKLFIFQKEL